MGSRIKERRKILGLTQVQLANKLGITKGAVGNYEIGASTPSPDILLKMFSVLECDANYLYQDATEALNANDSFSVEEHAIIKKYRAIDDRSRESVGALLDFEFRRENKPAKPPKIAAESQREVATIPFRCSVQPASAGTGAYLGPEEFEVLTVEENSLTRRGSFGVPVSGDSMEPRYHDGQILIIAGGQDVRIGEVGLFTLGGKGYVKKRGEGELISLNPNYAPIPMRDDIICNGRIVGVLKPEWIKGNV